MNEFTVKEYAARERVAPRTVWRWVEKGAVTTRRTPGGRLRIIERGGAPASGAVFITTKQDRPGQSAE